jgi:alanine dehydrogenase
LNAALPYILEVANNGITEVMKLNPSIEMAINTHDGELRNLIRLNPREE